MSIGTVDRVIHDRGEVSDTTRRKVLDIIKEMNFEPDILASTLASKKNYKLATLIPSINIDSHFWKAPLHGIEKGSKKQTISTH